MHHDYIIRSFASSISPATASLYTRLRLGDVVFAGSGETFEEIGKAAAFCDDQEAYAGSDTIIFRPTKDLLPRFAGYAVNGRKANSHKSRMGQGSSVIHISAEHLSQIPLRVPPLPQQHRIAEILSTAGEAISKSEALIAKTQQIKAGLTRDLFTRGVTPDGKLRPPQEEAPHLYKESPLGWIPRVWAVDTIGNLFERRVERGIPGLPIMSILMEKGLVPRDSVDRRVESNLPPEGHLLVRTGDIAYNMMRMWQGVLGRAEYDGLVSPAYVVMKPGPRIESVFAEYLLSTSSSIAKFKRRSYGVVDDRLRLYAADLVKIELAIPQLREEQLAISGRLAQTDRYLSDTETSLNKLRQLRYGLMNDLLTGRVPVKVPEAVEAPAHA